MPDVMTGTAKMLLQKSRRLSTVYRPLNCFEMDEPETSRGLSFRSRKPHALELPAALLDLFQLLEHLGRLFGLVHFLIVPGKVIVRGGITGTESRRFLEKGNGFEHLSCLFVHLSQLDVGVRQLGIEPIAF